MPNVFEKIESELAAANVDVLIQVQAGALGAVRLNFQQFSKNGRAEIQAFIDTLGNLPLPQDMHAQTLEDFFESVADTFPEQISGVSVELSKKSEAIIEFAEKTYLPPLQRFFDLYRCIDELLLKYDGLAFAGKSQSAAGSSAAEFKFFDHLKNDLDALWGALGDALDDPNKEPIDVLIPTLGVLISFVPREYFSTTQSPFIDEIQNLLDTLNEWQDMTEDELAKEILNRLGLSHDFLEECFEELNPLIIALQEAANELYKIYEANDPGPAVKQVEIELNELAVAITYAVKYEESYDAIDGIVDKLYASTEELKKQLTNVKTNFFDSDADEAVVEAAAELVAALKEKLQYILSQYEPALELDLVPLFPETFPAPEFDLGLEGVIDGVDNTLDGLCALIKKLNLQTIAADFKNSTDKLDAKITDWVTAKDDFYTDVETRLKDLQDKLTDFDLDQLEADIKTQLETYKNAVQAEVDWVFKKIRQLLDDFKQLADSTAGQYSYEDLEKQLSTFLQAISAIMQQFLKKLDKVKATLDKVSADIKTVSFKHVSDQVVTLIDGTTADLKNLDDKQLNNGLRFALTAALDVLPTQKILKKKMAELQDELDGLIEKGPIALMERIKDKPDELLDKIADNSPAPRVKAKLTVLYHTVLDALENFEPSQLLAPLEAKLRQIDAQLDQMDNPCKTLNLVVYQYYKIVDKLENLKADALLQALEAEKAKLTDAVKSVAPEAHIEVVIDRLEEIQKAIQELPALLGQISQITEKFDDPEAQLHKWLKPLYEKIGNLDQVVNFGDDVEQLLQKTRDLIDDFKINKLELKAETSIGALVGIMQVMEPKDQLTNLLLAYNNAEVSPYGELPDPQRIKKVEQFFEEFSPSDPIITENLTDLQTLLDQLNAFLDPLKDLAKYYLSDKSPIYACLPTNANIKQVIEDCIEAAFKKNLLLLLDLLPQIKAFVDALKGLLDAFVIGCLPDISGFIQGLKNIEDSFQTVKSNLANIDTTPLDGLNDLYEQAKTKLANFDLAAIQTTICDAFEDLRASLTLSKLLTEQDIQELDDIYANVLKVAQAFDPVTWVEEKLEPEFKRLLEPYLDSFDLGQYFEIILTRLQDLQQELREELDRIYKEFEEMLAAVPRLKPPVTLNLSV